MLISLGKCHDRHWTSASCRRRDWAANNLNSHIHWYERLFPLGTNGTIDTASVVNNNTFYTNAGKSMTHLINGAAGNLESHSEFSKGQHLQNITVVLNKEDYGFSKLTVINSTALTWEYIVGSDGSVRDSLTLLKPTEKKCH